MYCTYVPADILELHAERQTYGGILSSMEVGLSKTSANINHSGRLGEVALLGHDIVNSLKGSEGQFTIDRSGGSIAAKNASHLANNLVSFFYFRVHLECGSDNFTGRHDVAGGNIR